MTEAGFFPRRVRPGAAAHRSALRAHLAQRSYHATHRPFEKRQIARKESRDRVSGDQTDQQARGGAAVAHIQNFGGLAQISRPNAESVPQPVVAPINLCAHGFHGMRGVQDVFALQQAMDDGLANRKTAQNRGAMRNGFISGDAGGAFPGGRRRF